MVDAAALSVVIPTSGRWELLGQTLDALAAQTLSGFETVVVVDGDEVVVPDRLRERARFIVKPAEGPGVARNVGVEQAGGELILFLGDDTIPQPQLISAHLARHQAEPAREVAVLGHVDWHPKVARGAVNRWLDWSGSQFDYRQLRREDSADAGFGRFYTANVSLKRELFRQAGGFDEDFGLGYEDIEFGWRAAQLGMVLRYEPAAVVHHLHRYRLADLRKRFEVVGVGERVMVAKHPWFKPWFLDRFTRNVAQPPVSRLWTLLVDRVPENLERLWWPVHTKADRWYHQHLYDSFMRGWDRQSDLEELKAYLGERFELQSLWRHSEGIEREVAAVGDEARFYRTSRAYLYDLTAFAMTGTKEPYLADLRTLVKPGARVLDYGCGIGADGLRLLERGYAVEFADFDNPSEEFLRWRLAERGTDAPVHDLDREVPGEFDLAYAFDVIEHVEDPWAFLRAMEQRAAVVLVNLLEPAALDPSIHRDLPIKQIIRHAKRRGLLFKRTYYGRSHLIAYRGDR
jgi:GT2 family glycosyltransferase